MPAMVCLQLRPGPRPPTANALPTRLHFLVQTVLHDQGVGHGHPVGFHGVALAVVELPDVGIVKVGDLRGVAQCTRHWDPFSPIIPGDGNIYHPSSQTHVDAHLSLDLHGASRVLAPPSPALPGTQVKALSGPTQNSGTACDALRWKSMFFRAAHAVGCGVTGACGQDATQGRCRGLSLGWGMSGRSWRSRNHGGTPAVCSAGLPFMNASP